MAIPANPSVSDIVTAGLKHGGRINPSAGDITNFTNEQFQQVKADIYLAAPQHNSLEVVGCIPVDTSISRYNWPANCESIKSIQLVDAPTGANWLATAQAGGTASITLHTLFNENEDDIKGRMVCIVGGTGAGQFAQITAYNNSTKVATIEANWTTLDSSWVTPNSTSVYLVESMRYKLYDIDKQIEFDTITAPYLRGTPRLAVLVGRQIWLNYVPDRQYAMLVTYWFALDRLDEAATLFLDHLRKFRSVWVQGIAVKACQRYDEQRYVTESQIYRTMLGAYGGRAATVGQTQFRDF